MQAATRLNRTGGSCWRGAPAALLAALLLWTGAAAQAAVPPDYYAAPDPEQVADPLPDEPPLPPPPTVPLENVRQRPAPEAPRFAPRYQRTAERWKCPPISLAELLHVGIGGLVGNGPTRMVLDVRWGMLCVRNASGDPDAAGMHLLPEIGYSMVASGSSNASGPTASMALGGVGVGYGNQWAGIAFTPRLMLGSDGAAVFGLRTGISGRFLLNLFSVEVAHHLLYEGGAVRQGVMGMVSINALVLVMLYGLR